MQIFEAILLAGFFSLLIIMCILVDRRRNIRKFMREYAQQHGLKLQEEDTALLTEILEGFPKKHFWFTEIFHMIEDDDVTLFDGYKADHRTFRPKFRRVFMALISLSRELDLAFEVRRNKYGFQFYDADSIIDFEDFVKGFETPLSEYEHKIFDELREELKERSIRVSFSFESYGNHGLIILYEPVDLSDTVQLDQLRTIAMIFLEILSPKYVAL